MVLIILMSQLGGYDSSKTLVGLYILDILSRIVSPEQMGLYHIDGIIYIPNSNGPDTSRIQKKIIRAFKFLGFKIEVSSNNKTINFLDLTLTLSNNTYKPFLKTDLYPSYINVNSNHPKTIIKQVPKAVKLRIRDLSAKREVRYKWMPLKMAGLGRSLPIKKKIYLMILIKNIRSTFKK